LEGLSVQLFRLQFSSEVTFNIDASGMANVTAVTESRGKKYKIPFTNDQSRLSKEEIEHMVKDAEKYRAKHKKQKQPNSARRALRLYCFNMIRSVEDKKLKENTILDKCNGVVRWLDDNQLAEKEEFESQQKELESVCNPIMKKMGKRAGQSLVTAEQGRKRDKQSYIANVHNLALSLEA
jgi:L1 cell adhesion molecule like protein